MFKLGTFCVNVILIFKGEMMKRGSTQTKSPANKGAA